MSASSQADDQNKSLDELIQLGLKLVEKQRSATSIYQALKANAASKEDLNAAMEIVFEEPIKQPKKKYTPEVQTMLKANRIKLSFDYTLKSMIYIPLFVFVLGIVVLVLANEKVNQNAPFAYWTLTQGCLLLLLLLIAQQNKIYSLLLIAALGFAVAYILELLLLGIPNDLFKAHYANEMAIRTHSKAFVVLVVGYTFPFLYLGIKIFVCLINFSFYRRFKQYDNLSDQTKLDLIEFQAK